QRALVLRCDVSRVEDVKAAMDKTGATFGRLDFAFNNAGIEPRKPAPTADYDLEEWDRIIDIDLRGVFLCMKYEVPSLMRCVWFYRPFFPSRLSAVFAVRSAQLLNGLTAVDD